MWGKIFTQKFPHALTLPEKENVYKKYFEDTLQVWHKKNQSKQHSKKNSDENTKDHTNILCQETQGEKVVDGDAE